MASIFRDVRLNPSVELIKTQRSQIYECENTIHLGINNTLQNCTHINELLCQLKLLYKMHFMYEEQLFDELNVPAASELKKIHDLFLKSIDQLKTENNQCHTPSYSYDFIKLKLDFILNLNTETKMLCDFISMDRH